MGGTKLLLEVLNDISSIDRTLQSNHTLQCLYLSPPEGDPSDVVWHQNQIELALDIIAKMVSLRIILKLEGRR